MLIPAKAEYGMRALLALAALDEATTAEALAQSQNLPINFLRAILNDLRRADLVVSQRGAVGGYRLARPPSTITLAEVIRVLSGPLAEVRGVRPENTEYFGAATHLKDVWVAVATSLDTLLCDITLEDVLQGRPSSSVAPPAG
ncbi:MAG TPA: Rrf2 family transcriptional regulator [Acidimicrobiales bacterium]|nr:Rrf2 family transcriptional regulator [Acidimicrobiales bacterium]